MLLLLLVGELLEDVPGHTQVVPGDPQGPDHLGLREALGAQGRDEVHVEVLVGDVAGGGAAVVVVLLEAAEVEGGRRPGGAARLGCGSSGGSGSGSALVLLLVSLGELFSLHG